jgi:hypothetical protein
MAYIMFDTCIRLNKTDIEKAGLSVSLVIADISAAVRRMNGVGWVDVDLGADLPSVVVIYGPGRSVVPDSPRWRHMQRRVEAVAQAAVWMRLDGAATGDAPFFAFGSGQWRERPDSRIKGRKALLRKSAR